MPDSRHAPVADRPDRLFLRSGRGEGKVAFITGDGGRLRPGSPAAALRCHASMSDSRPKDYTTIYVNIGTVRYAGVTTVAHYKTVNREHTGKANAEGNAKIGYYISGATPGYQVNVSVTVTSGRSRGTCSTSFIPHR